MGAIERITDRSDPRLRDFTDLRDVQLRTVREPAEGLFIAEGEATIRRAIAAGYHPRAVLATERWLGTLHAVLATTDVPTLLVDEALLEATTGFPIHRGALASMDRRPLPDLDTVLAEAGRVLVLEDLADHTNVGSVFRSAAALGMDAVVLTPRCADPLYRRAVRTSMGAVFAIPWTRIDWFHGPSRLREADFQIVALTPADDAIELRSLGAGPPRAALALGSEGAGLSRHWLEASDIRVRISMANGADSLNVAAAAAVACFALGGPHGD